MKVCDKCGTEYEDYANYCNACDLSLNESIEDGNISDQDVDKHVMTVPKRRLINTHRALGSLQLLLIAFLAYNVFIYKSPTGSGVAMVLVLTIFPLMHFSIAKGIREGKSWSQMVSMFMAFIFLFGFPVGTIIGVFMLVNLFSKDWDAKLGAGISTNV